MIAVILVCHPAYVHHLPAAIRAIDAQGRPFNRKVLVFDCANQEAPAFAAPSGWQMVVGKWANPNHARNAGLQVIQAARAWVCFWDADNVMPPGYAEAGAKAVDTATAEVGVFYPDLVRVCADGRVKGRITQPDWTLHDAQERSLCDSASFWRVQAVLEVGGWSPRQRGHDDYELSLRLWRSGWQGRRLGAEFRHLVHPTSRSATQPIVENLWNAWSFAIVTLWGGNQRTEARVLEWLATAEIPPNTTLYWVDNSGGRLKGHLTGEWLARLSHRFKGMVWMEAGTAYNPAAGEHYLHIARHTHVAHLYNRILPRVREEMVITLEDDTVPPHDGVRELLALMRPFSKVAVAAGVYRSRTNPARICAARDKSVWNNVPQFDDLPAEPFEVGMTGGGFAIMANWALQKVLPMRCEYSRIGSLMGWDGNLGLSLTARGYKLLAHPGVKCLHLCPEVLEYERKHPNNCPPTNQPTHGCYGVY